MFCAIYFLLLIFSLFGIYRSRPLELLRSGNIGKNRLQTGGKLQIIPLDDYNRLMADNETLEKDECLLYCKGINYKSGSLSDSIRFTLWDS